MISLDATSRAQLEVIKDQTMLNFYYYSRFHVISWWSSTKRNKGRSNKTGNMWRWITTDQLLLNSWQIWMSCHACWWSSSKRGGVGQTRLAMHWRWITRDNNGTGAFMLFTDEIQRNVTNECGNWRKWQWGRFCYEL